jgi:PKD repeat protein
MKCRKVSIIVLVALTIVSIGICSADESVSRKVSANPLWTNVDLNVAKGQTVSITASGTWNCGEGTKGPTGDNAGGLYDLFLNSTAPSKHGELIAFIGPTSTDPYQGNWGNRSFFPRPVGAGYWAIGNNTTFTADRDGELWLGINDDAVTKTIGDNTGSLVTVITITSIIPTSGSPVTNFTSDVTAGTPPLSVQFTDTSTGNPTSWNWDFGDSNSATLQNPEHTYTTTGHHTVTLTVTNTVGSNTLVKPNYISDYALGLRKRK